MEYGYVRISTKKQNMERQIRNIKSEYPNAEIYQEIYTGTKLNKRTEFQKLLKIVKTGDTIIFDSVSRMSRIEKEGVELYLKLYNKGVELVFLKEKYINTSIFRNLTTSSLKMTRTNTDTIVESINKYLMSLAELQVKIAFVQSEKEVKDLRQRTKEGIETARLQGKQIGQKKGKKLHIKKKRTIKKTN